MQVTAKLKHLRMAPRKMRLVADLIRGKMVFQAKAELSFLKRYGARPFLKLLNSAIANAKNNFQLDEKDLYLAKVLVDEGSKLKRWRPRARGQAYPIQKKTSHLTIILDQKQGAQKTKIKKTSLPKSEEKPETGIKPQAVREKPRIEKPVVLAKPQLKPEIDIKPKQVRGLKRIFRRKAF